MRFVKNYAFNAYRADGRAKHNDQKNSGSEILPGMSDALCREHGLGVIEAGPPEERSPDARNGGMERPPVLPSEKRAPAVEHQKLELAAAVGRRLAKNPKDLRELFQSLAENEGIVANVRGGGVTLDGMVADSDGFPARKKFRLATIAETPGAPQAVAGLSRLAKEARAKGGLDMRMGLPPFGTGIQGSSESRPGPGAPLAGSGFDETEQGREQEEEQERKDRPLPPPFPRKAAAAHLEAVAARCMAARPETLAALLAEMRKGGCSVKPAGRSLAAITPLGEVRLARPREGAGSPATAALRRLALAAHCKEMPGAGFMQRAAATGMESRPRGQAPPPLRRSLPFEFAGRTRAARLALEALKRTETPKSLMGALAQLLAREIGVSLRGRQPLLYTPFRKRPYALPRALGFLANARGRRPDPFLLRLARALASLPRGHAPPRAMPAPPPLPHAAAIERLDSAVRGCLRAKPKSLGHLFAMMRKRGCEPVVSGNEIYVRAPFADGLLVLRPEMTKGGLVSASKLLGLRVAESHAAPLPMPVPPAPPAPEGPANPRNSQKPPAALESAVAACLDAGPRTLAEFFALMERQECFAALRGSDISVATPLMERNARLSGLSEATRMRIAGAGFPDLPEKVAERLGRGRKKEAPPPPVAGPESGQTNRRQKAFERAAALASEWLEGGGNGMAGLAAHMERNGCRAVLKKDAVSVLTPHYGNNVRLTHGFLKSLRMEIEEGRKFKEAGESKARRFPGGSPPPEPDRADNGAGAESLSPGLPDSPGPVLRSDMYAGGPPETEPLRPPAYPEKYAYLGGDFSGGRFGPPVPGPPCGGVSDREAGGGDETPDLRPEPAQGRPPARRR